MISKNTNLKYVERCLNKQNKQKKTQQLLNIY